MSKVLLLGGTGAMGVYLADLLVEQGCEVVISSRKNRKNEPQKRYVVGNGHDIEFVQLVLENEKPDAIVDFMDYATDEFAARRDILLAGTKHYLFLSSYRVFADDNPVTERSPRLLDVVQDIEYLKTDEYALHKARAENALRSASAKNWTILRPCITYSKERFQLGCLEADTVCYRALQGLPVVMPRELFEKKTTLTWGRDVALLISKLILNLKAYGEDFNVVTPESHTWREVADIYRKSIGLEVREISLAAYMEMCNPAQVKYDRMFNRVMDNRKVLEATGVKEEDFAKLETGLPRELEAFRRNPHYRQTNLWQNAAMDRLCGTRISLSSLSARELISYLKLRYRTFRLLFAVLAMPKRIVQK